MSFAAISESRILEAMAEGKFRNLEGKGRRLRIADEEKLAGDDWLGNHVLEAAKSLPEWLLLGKDIERQEGAVRERMEIFVHLVERGRDTGDWDRYELALVDTLERFVPEATELRRMQDRFNYMAPGRLTQRPGFWTSFHLKAMVDAAVEAGADSDALAAFRPDS